MRSLNACPVGGRDPAVRQDPEHGRVAPLVGRHQRPEPVRHTQRLTFVLINRTSPPPSGHHTMQLGLRDAGGHQLFLQPVSDAAVG